MTKQMVWAEVSHFEPEGTIKEVLDTINGYMDLYGEDCRIEHRKMMWEDEWYYAVEVQKLETEGQYQFRLAHEAEMKTRQTERDKQEFARLKAIYDNVDIVK
jgi:hypothetical protein